MPSFHQDDLFTSLAASSDVDLKVVFARELTADRVQMGWHTGARQYRHATLRRPHALLEAARLAQREAHRLHLVNGIWAEPAFAAALVALRLAGSCYAIYSEGPDDPERQSLLRSVVRTTYGRWIAQGAAGILTVSQFAADFYRALGCADDRLYPFGYFRARPDKVPAADRGTATPTEIIFVGRLVRDKGLGVLLDALQPLLTEQPGMRLTLIGEGDQRAALAAQAAAEGFQDRIIFMGAMPADETQARIASSDLLVLPSRWDGWGMVINEALAVGVPVIASDACGASDLIRQGVNGYVFASGKADSLRDCLRGFCNQSSGERLRMRRAARATGETLAADRAARYLIDCLKHATGLTTERPRVPWLESECIEATGH